MPRKIRPKAPPPRTTSIFDRIDLNAGDMDAINATAKKAAYLNIYTPEILNRICEDHKIDKPELRTELWHSLEFQAVQYRDLAQRKEAKATSAEIRGELSDIEELLEALISHFPFHPDIQRLLVKSETDIASFPFSEYLKPLAAIGAAKQIGGPEEWAFSTLEDIQPQLGLLLFHIRNVQGKLPRGKDGRPLNLPLYAWVSCLANFWQSKLDRPFTIDVHKSDGALKAEGTSPSYTFLRDCLVPLDPGQVDLLASMMRRVSYAPHLRLQSPFEGVEPFFLVKIGYRLLP